MSTPFIIGGLVAIIVSLVLYALLMPKGNNGQVFNSEEMKDSGLLLRMMSSIGNDFYNALPEGVIDQNKRRSANPRVESLIVRSGNPWNLNVTEFVSLQYLSAFLGFIAGWLAWFGLSVFTEIPWFVVVGLVTLFAFFIPRIKYSEQAKARDLEFKRQLPEALDLLIISLSGGRTFTQSVREIIPNMNESVLKEEFKNIVKSIDSGKTLNEALDDFATKAPNESILTFIRSVQSATEVNAPLVETLEARAEASRQEFFALIHEKTAQLESKIFMALTPTMMPAVMIIAIAPSAFSMMGTLGS